MKIKKIFVIALSMAILTGCTSSVIELSDDTDENNTDNVSQEENDNSNSSNSSDEKNSKADSESSSSDQNDNDDTLWDSPMAEYVPESPYPYFISFVNGEIATKSDDYYISDYITGDYKYICCQMRIFHPFLHNFQEIDCQGFSNHQQCNMIRRHSKSSCQNQGYLPSNRLISLHYSKSL